MKAHILFAILTATLVTAGVATEPVQREAHWPPSVTLTPPGGHLRGTASGGELVLVDALSPGSFRASVETEPGEPAERVAARVAEAINKVLAEPPYPAPIRYRVEEGTTRLTGGNPLALHGTESGLGIPPAPLGVTGYHDAGEDRFHLSWTLPPDAEYETILVLRWASGAHDFVGELQLPSSASGHAWPSITWRPFDPRREAPRPETSYFFVTGVRDGVRSAAAGIDISGGMARESLGFPHVDGVTPNWLRWSLERDALPEASQGHREEGSVLPGAVPTSPEELRIYQEISPRTSAASGLIRPLNGYKAGDAVALSGRLRLDEALRGREDWSVEFRMVHLADLASAIDSRSSMRLTAEALGESTLLGRIGPGGSPAHGEWFAFGVLDDPAVPLEMWLPGGEEGSALFAIVLSGMEGARIDMDWFTAERRE